MHHQRNLLALHSHCVNPRTLSWSPRAARPLVPPPFSASASDDAPHAASRLPRRRPPARRHRSRSASLTPTYPTHSPLPLKLPLARLANYFASLHSLRPRRSRKDRPCDHCRRSKRSCHIAVRGQACAQCAKSGRDCSFVGPPVIRHRKAASSSSAMAGGPGPETLQYRQATAAAGMLQPQLGLAGVAGAPLLSVPRMGALPMSNGPPSSQLISFIDGLDYRSPNQQADDSALYSSLDMDVTEEEESHYLGSGAVAHLASVSLDSLDHVARTQSGSLAYRQVADPRYPAFFLRNPSRVYGLSNAAFVAEKAYQHVIGILASVDPRMPERLIQAFLTRTLPALPILNRARFEASLNGWQAAAAFPSAILVGIFAHSSIYEPALKAHSKELWSILLHVMDNEYRQVRLQTLILEILEITGRPITNPGGNHLGICRAVGAIQLLGLHRDCSRWKLPKWERSLRKRLWWALYVQDKWNAYTYGRPVNIDSSRSAIPPVTFEDDDLNEDGQVPLTGNEDIAVFIATCRLSTILEAVLPLLLDRDSQPRRPRLDRSILKHAASELEMVYSDLPQDLVFRPENAIVRAGARSLQLAHFGLALLICRLGLERDDLTPNPEHVLQSIRNALTVIENLALFLETLWDDDYKAYWSPWSAYQLSNAITLLLQQAIRIHELDHKFPTPTPDAERTLVLGDVCTVLARITSSVQRTADAGWEVAEAALPRIKSLVKSVPAVIPGIDAIRAMLGCPVAMAGVNEWGGYEMPEAKAPAARADAGIEPDGDILALFDWLNGDMTSVF
ncbi:hypothetical protein VHUM_03261 [Vanrija humicola]|uniref:Zn(2)-C6 fungal-type domain-containing protein n=1 Tax=Vanrija humicola TaxID=5417 RepID=A0A7D8UXJ6_VANHU|nr:hypothetical protein VHUM_03261 [Vanrija humicola]